MNILYLYAGFPAYRRDFFDLLNKKLSDNGHQFKVIYLKRNDTSLQITDVDFDASPCNRKETSFGIFKFQSFEGIKPIFKAFRPDVVVFQFHVAIITYWWVYFYCKLHGVPYITWDCNWTRDTLQSWLVRFRTTIVDFTYIKATTCLTYGTVFKDYLLKIGKKSEDVFVAQNTVNVEKLIAERAQICDNRSFNHPLHFLYVGALIHRKFVMPAVEAVSELIKDGNNIFFDIVGNGDEYDNIKQFITNNKIDDRIILHGAKHGAESKAFFENSDVFVMPGTGGLAINEAMAYSLPIISTLGDDTVKDLIDGNGYLLSNFGDKDEIKETILKFINLSEEEKVAMANRSKILLLEVATMDNMANQHVSAIERALKKCR